MQRRVVPVPQLAKGRTVACIGTGPSLTPEQIDTARDKGFSLFGCNLTYKLVPDLTVLYAVNSQFWEQYWEDGLEDHPASKWTTTLRTAVRYGLNWIGERNTPGLSQTHEYVHHGHGSGFTQVNLAYDLKYAPDYDGKSREIGSAPRHYFGEYPHSMQHWPSVKVQKGVHVELLDLYRSVADQGLIEIINCTPDSALDCFEKRDINAL